MSVPVGTPLGTEVSHTVSASNTLAEGAYSNNTANWTVLVTGSFDPNDKVARTSSAQSSAVFYLDQDDYVDYTIRFQNTGTDTAFTVIITDTLSPALDMTSFEQGVASHPFEVRFKAGRVVEWRFDGIMLPDSTSNEARSHGLVSFRLRPVLPLVAGTVIENTANIFFDFNDPVITEPSVLTAEFSTGVQAQGRERKQPMLIPNPAGELVRITAPQMIEELRLISMDGRLIQQQRVGANIAALDLSSLAAGAYTVDIRMTNGSVAQEILIKH